MAERNRVHKGINNEQRCTKYCVCSTWPNMTIWFSEWCNINSGLMKTELPAERIKMKVVL